MFKNNLRTVWISIWNDKHGTLTWASEKVTAVGERRERSKAAAMPTPCLSVLLQEPLRATDISCPGDHCHLHRYLEQVCSTSCQINDLWPHLTSLCGGPDPSPVSQPASLQMSCPFWNVPERWLPVFLCPGTFSSLSSAVSSCRCISVWFHTWWWRHYKQDLKLNSGIPISYTGLPSVIIHHNYHYPSESFSSGNWIDYECVFECPGVQRSIL